MLKTKIFQQEKILIQTDKQVNLLHIKCCEVYVYNMKKMNCQILVFSF